MFVQGAGSGGSSPPHSSDDEEDELITAFSNLTHAGGNSAAKKASKETPVEKATDVFFTDLKNFSVTVKPIAGKRQDPTESVLSGIEALLPSLLNAARSLPSPKSAEAKQTKEEPPPLELTKQGKEIRFQVVQKTLSEAQVDPCFYKLPIHSAIRILFLKSCNQISKQITLSTRQKGLIIALSHTLFFSFYDDEMVAKLLLFIKEFEAGMSKEEKEKCQKELSFLKKFQFLIKYAHLDHKDTFREACGQAFEFHDLTNTEKQQATLDLLEAMHFFSKLLDRYFQEVASSIARLKEVIDPIVNKPKEVIQGLKEDIGFPDQGSESFLSKFTKWENSIHSLSAIFFIRHAMIGSCFKGLHAAYKKQNCLNSAQKKEYAETISANITLIQKTVLNCRKLTDYYAGCCKSWFTLEEEKAILRDLECFDRIGCRPDLVLNTMNEEWLDSSDHNLSDLAASNMLLGLRNRIESSQLHAKTLFSHAGRQFNVETIASLLPPPVFEARKKEIESNLHSFEKYKCSLEICRQGLRNLEFLATLFMEVSPTAETASWSLEESLAMLDDKPSPALRKKAFLKQQHTEEATPSEPPAKSKGKKKEKPSPIILEPTTFHPITTENAPYIQQLTSFGKQLENALKLEPHSRADIAFQNALYHLQVLGTTLDLLNSAPSHLSPNAEQALRFRLARSSSLFFEQTVTALYLKDNPTGSLKHYPISLLEKMNKWEKLPGSLKSYAQATNYGAVIPRYPHNVQSRFQAHGTPEPLTLSSLLTPCPLSEVSLLARGPLEWIGYLLAERKRKNNSVKKAQETISSFFKEQKVTPKEGQPVAFKQWEPLLKTIEEALAILDHISATNQNNLKDIRFGLNGLKGEIELFMTHPEVAFLASHVDAILTRIQFVDELIQETLHPLIFDTEFRTHDLQDYRLLRHFQESPENDAALSAVNIGMWAQYPHTGMRKIRQFNQKNQGKLPAISTPQAISLRMKSAEFSIQGEIYDSGFTPAKGKKERSEINLEKGPLRIQQKLFELTNRLLTMEHTSLLEILTKSENEREKLT